MTLKTGQTLGHYRIERLIGQGGMGAVFCAEDTKLYRKVALKVLPAEMASNADRLARFQREAQAVAALNHPHIVTLFSVEEAEGTHFLTMELIEGDSLDHELPPGGLPLAKVFDIGASLADALTAAHEKGVIHRDLKPANVIITKDGRVKVLDFGLAKLALSSSEDQPAAVPETSGAPTEIGRRDQSLTAAGLMVGTVPYMSPEQVNGRTVDARTDIFSLGVVLYELATGRRPFAGGSPAETISSILRDIPRPVTEARREAPRHLGRIIDHCLQKDPEARFQTAKDVRNELRALRREVESGDLGQASQIQTSSPAAIAASTPAAVSTMSGEAAGAGSSRAWIWAIVGAAVVIAIGAAFWLGGRRSAGPGTDLAPATDVASGTATGSAGAAKVNSLAVLPFTNMSADKDQEYFSDGLTEELLNALVKIPDLKVAGRTSSFAFKGKNEDMRTIGEKLGVTNLLEGSVRKSGNRVRITVQLVKAADGFHLWSETYDRTLDDIFAVQDDIAKSVASALQVTLVGRGAEAKTPDTEAYDLVLQAHFVMQAVSKESIDRARPMLEQALKLSPDYAPAWAEMGVVHLRESEIALTVTEVQQGTRRAKEALARALELDPNLAVARSRMAGVQMKEWDFAGASQSMNLAMAAPGASSSILVNAAGVYSALGRVEEASAVLKRALSADPLNVVAYTNLARFELYLDRLDAAEADGLKALELRKNNVNAYWVLGDIHLRRGQTEQARAAYAKAMELTGGEEHERLFYEAYLEHTAGNAEASKRATEEFEKKFGAEDPTGAAFIHAWRGEVDAAFAWLDKALDAHDPNLSSLKYSADLKSLHSDPRWNALLKKIGLPTD